MFAVLARAHHARMPQPDAAAPGGRVSDIRIEQEPVPMQIHSYLMFPGTAREAFAFYAQVLGGEITASMTYGDSPEGETPEPYRDWIMHTSLNIGDQMLMGSDHAPFCPGPGFEGIKGISVSLQFDAPAEAERVFAALSADAKEVQMPIQETFWAQRFGMCTDRFGVPWMVNCSRTDAAADCG
jgi:PhnB protein